MTALTETPTWMTMDFRRRWQTVRRSSPSTISANTTMQKRFRHGVRTVVSRGPSTAAGSAQRSWRLRRQIQVARQQQFWGERLHALQRQGQRQNIERNAKTIAVPHSMLQVWHTGPHATTLSLERYIDDADTDTATRLGEACFFQVLWPGHGRSVQRSLCDSPESRVARMCLPTFVSSGQSESRVCIC